jgi:hypothetical protein
VGFKDRMKDAASKATEVAKERAAEARERSAPAREKMAETTQRRKELGAEIRANVGGGPTIEKPGILFEGVSHEEGRNATVTLYPDRIERVKARSRVSVSKAVQETEVTPVRAVSSVQARKDGWKTVVTVFASGNNIDFRFEHDEAHRFKDALMSLVTAPGNPLSVPTSGSAPSTADELKKLTELRDAGVLSDAEFDAQKAKLLG